MSSRLKDLAGSISKNKKIDPGKSTDLEKGDYKALVLAAYSVFAPAAIGTVFFFAAVILLFLMLWGA